MMVIGISGCTALLLTGFGINDSIAGFADRQFDEIQILDGTMTLAESVDDVKKTNAASEEIRRISRKQRRRVRNQRQPVICMIN